MNLADALVELPGLFAGLPDFRLPGSLPPDGQPARKPVLSERALLRFDVLDLMDGRGKDADMFRDDADLDRRIGARRVGILPALTAWARRVDAELETGYPLGVEPCGRMCVESPTPALVDERHGPCSEDAEAHSVDLSVAYVCRWLAPHVEWISDQPWGRGMAADVQRMVKDCRSATGWQPPVKDQLWCTHCHDRVHEQDGGGWFRCAGCHRSWGRLELHRMAERLQPKTLKQCAQMLGVSERTLREYERSGLVRPLPGSSPKRYDYAAVHEAAQLARYQRRVRPRRVDARGRFATPG